MASARESLNAALALSTAVVDARASRLLIEKFNFRDYVPSEYEVLIQRRAAQIIKGPWKASSSLSATKNVPIDYQQGIAFVVSVQGIGTIFPVRLLTSVVCEILQYRVLARSNHFHRLVLVCCLSKKQSSENHKQ